MAEIGEAWQNRYPKRLMHTVKEEEVNLSEYECDADACFSWTGSSMTSTCTSASTARWATSRRPSLRNRGRVNSLLLFTKVGTRSAQFHGVSAAAP